MATWSTVFTRSKTVSGKTIKGTSNLSAVYVEEVVEKYGGEYYAFRFTQTSHSSTYPVFSGTTGNTSVDSNFKGLFSDERLVASDLKFDGVYVRDGVVIEIPLSHTSRTVVIQLGDSTRNITIPANYSYTVTFDGNSGNDVPTQQTKWYNEELELTLQTPIKDGYNFIGWATSTARASSGNVDYLAGGTIPYNVNEDITLYAVWELAYTKPHIDEGSLIIERCLSDGTLDDEGTYALVEFDWSVYRNANARFYGGSATPYTNNGSSVTIQVGTYSVTATSSNASGTYSEVLGNGNLSTDRQYAVTITLTDTETVQVDKSTVILGNLSTSEFPMDFNNAGTAMGIFMPAPDNEEGVFIGKTLHVRDGNNIMRTLIDFVRPVGSTFATKDPNFDPNDVWLGTQWNKLPEGYVILSGSDSGTYVVGDDTNTASGYKEYGDNEHKHSTGNFELKEAHIPAHTHGSAGAHTHQLGRNQNAVQKGTNYDKPNNASATTDRGYTSTSAGAHTHKSFGGSQAHNHGDTGNGSTMQKSIAVYWWIRTL